MNERSQYRINPTDKIEVGIIGAGAVGLSIARELVKQGREVIVFEAENNFGMHASSRNSEVIHSGIYYEPGSLKASLCVAGRQRLYSYCEEKEIPFNKLGKLIVAQNEEEIASLRQLKMQGEQNGIGDLTILDHKQLKELEPAVEGVSALLSPSTGIFDSHEYMKWLTRDINKHNSWIQVSSPVLKGEVHDNGIALSIGGENPMDIFCDVVVNSAGFYSQDVASRIDGIPPESIPDLYLSKGHYFTLKGNTSFSHLIYPLPEPGGLGIHLTLDMDNRVRFGPDVSRIDEIDYSFDETRAPAFYDRIRTYYPALVDGQLQEGYTGIRSKLAGRGSPSQDFIIQGKNDHGIDGLVNLYGIESPGLTASLAIAEHVKILLA